MTEKVRRMKNKDNGAASPHAVKGYAFFRVHTCADDHYVGPIKNSMFVGNHLHVTLSPLVKVLREGPETWLPATGGRFAEYEFDFNGCTIAERGGAHIKVRTPEGDEIILSNEEQDEQEINNLVS